MNNEGISAEIAKAILSIMKDMPALNKADHNKFAKYNYVSIDTYYEAIRSLAANHGLVWNLRQIEVPAILPVGKDGAMMFSYAVDLIHASGEIIKAFSALSIPHPIQGPQTAGSAMSYADKLFMRQLFKIPTGEYDADHVDPADLKPDTKPDAAKVVPMRQAAEPQKRGPVAIDANFPPIGNQPTSSGAPEGGAPEGGLAAAPTVASPPPASPEGEIGGISNKELLDRLDPDGTLAPQFDNDYGVPILATVKPTDALHYNWDAVVTIFDEFIPRCSTKMAVRRLWERNEGTLRQLKIVQPGMYKSIMSWMKKQDSKLAE